MFLIEVMIYNDILFTLQSVQKCEMFREHIHFKYMQMCLFILSMSSTITHVSPKVRLMFPGFHVQSLKSGPCCGDGKSSQVFYQLIHGFTIYRSVVKIKFTSTILY